MENLNLIVLVNLFFQFSDIIFCFRYRITMNNIFYWLYMFLENTEKLKLKNISKKIKKLSTNTDVYQKKLRNSFLCPKLLTSSICNLQVSSTTAFSCSIVGCGISKTWALFETGNSTESSLAISTSAAFSAAAFSASAATFSSSAF